MGYACMHAHVLLPWWFRTEVCILVCEHGAATSGRQATFSKKENPHLHAGARSTMQASSGSTPCTRPLASGCCISRQQAVLVVERQAVQQRAPLWQ